MKKFRMLFFLVLLNGSSVYAMTTREKNEIRFRIDQLFKSLEAANNNQEITQLSQQIQRAIGQLGMDDPSERRLYRILIDKIGQVNTIQDLDRLLAEINQIYIQRPAQRQKLKALLDETVRAVRERIQAAQAAVAAQQEADRQARHQARRQERRRARREQERQRQEEAERRRREQEQREREARERAQREQERQRLERLEQERLEQQQEQARREREREREAREARERAEDEKHRRELERWRREAQERKERKERQRREQEERRRREQERREAQEQARLAREREAELARQRAKQAQRQQEQAQRIREQLEALLETARNQEQRAQRHANSAARIAQNIPDDPTDGVRQANEAAAQAQQAWQSVQEARRQARAIEVPSFVNVENLLAQFEQIEQDAQGAVTQANQSREQAQQVAQERIAQMQAQEAQREHEAEQARKREEAERREQEELARQVREREEQEARERQAALEVQRAQAREREAEQELQRKIEAAALLAAQKVQKEEARRKREQERERQERLRAAEERRRAKEAERAAIELEALQEVDADPEVRQLRQEIVALYRKIRDPKEIGMRTMYEKEVQAKNRQLHLLMSKKEREAREARQAGAIEKRAREREQARAARQREREERREKERQEREARLAEERAREEARQAREQERKRKQEEVERAKEREERERVRERTERSLIRLEREEERGREARRERTRIIERVSPSGSDDEDDDDDALTPDERREAGERAEQRRAREAGSQPTQVPSAVPDYRKIYGDEIFEKFIQPIPERLQPGIIEAAKRNLQKGLPAFFEDNKDKKLESLPLRLIGAAYRVENFAGGGSLYFRSPDELMRGKRAEEQLQFDNAEKTVLQLYDEESSKGNQAKAQRYIPVLFGSYKIHLMPAKPNKLQAVIKLLHTLSTDLELQPLIHTFKVAMSDLPYQQARDQTEQNAVIVIYPRDGKDNTQRALNKIYTAFKNFSGMNIKPRFNARVNDLIWIAQGDGDAKRNSHYQKYFDDTLVYYNPAEFGRPNEDMHLRNPETNEDIVGEPIKKIAAQAPLGKGARRVESISDLLSGGGGAAAAAPSAGAAATVTTTTPPTGVSTGQSLADSVMPTQDAVKKQAFQAAMKARNRIIQYANKVHAFAKDPRFTFDEKAQAIERSMQVAQSLFEAVTESADALHKLGLTGDEPAQLLKLTREANNALTVVGQLQDQVRARIRQEEQREAKEIAEFELLTLPGLSDDEFDEEVTGWEITPTSSGGGASAGEQ